MPSSWLAYLLFNAVMVLCCLGCGAVLGAEVGPVTFLVAMAGLSAVDLVLFLLQSPR